MASVILPESTPASDATRLHDRDVRPKQAWTFVVYSGRRHISDISPSFAVTTSLIRDRKIRDERPCPGRGKPSTLDDPPGVDEGLTETKSALDRPAASRGPTSPRPRLREAKRHIYPSAGVDTPSTLAHVPPESTDAQSPNWNARASDHQPNRATNVHRRSHRIAA